MAGHQKNKHMSVQKNTFINAVTQSRVLTREQKEGLLADPQLPEAYQVVVMNLLTEFDKNSKERELFLRDKMKELYTEFIAQLDAEGIEEDKKKELLEKAKKQMESFSPSYSVTE